MTIVLAIGLLPSVIALPPEARCRPVLATIARAARQVYQDPTEENRARVTFSLVRQLAPYKAAVDAGPCDFSDEGLVSDWTTIFDGASLPPSLRVSVDDRHPSSLSRAAREELADEARRACKPPAGEDCTLNHLQFLVLSDDSGATGLLERRADLRALLHDERATAISAWIDLRRAYPERVPFIRAALRSENTQVRNWAIDDAAGSIDPRVWDPRDVAVLVLEARDMDRQAAKIEAQPRSALESLQASDQAVALGPARATFFAIYGRLGRMGFQRAFDLIQPGFARPGVKSNGAVAVGPEHFGGEGQACAEDWLEKNHLPDLGRLSKPDWARYQQACDQMWLQTDDAAPHPDTKAIQRAIEQLDGKRDGP